eukprot:CAMPEP_0117590962 /NCGR_PEP_ID=MMETSP0784-20121206/71264_1 /TAXON_ID=39447 /ORGANISM="" /LENGTH=83 /DNA_ID=CAMNT_0005392623 /DNA_START=35 /DNA_END=287 /DNA_ORIENTATION=+
MSLKVLAYRVVGLGDFLEPRRGSHVSWVLVWMVLQREVPVGPAHRVSIRPWRNAQDFATLGQHAPGHRADGMLKRFGLIAPLE